MIRLNLEQVNNLNKLAKFLSRFRESPKRKFDMAGFTECGNWGYEAESKTECGTVGCALGWLPSVGIPKTSEENWIQYSKRVLGFSEGYEWDWLFSEQWRRTDNTPQGAAKRIKVLLEKGLPNDWREQMRGDCSLCY